VTAPPVELAGLAELYGLTAPQLDRLRCLAELVGSDPLAPTSVRAPERVLADHIADSLVALDLPALAAPARLVDIGAGAGFPGLVLAVTRRATSVTLLEASARKCAFMERAAASCSLRNVDVVHARAEDWPEGLGQFDVATARAVAPLAVVLEYAAPLLRPGGWVVAWRGRRDLLAESGVELAARELGLELGEVRRVEPYPGAMHRHLHVARKVGPTPREFPRRPGVARKRPLGAR
jgi:16S rRNA (guanine527-N7)-methyltransferase